MSEKQPKLYPDNWYHDECNRFVLAIEAQVLEQLMNEMYEAQEKAEKCGCPQCVRRGDATRIRFWKEQHRARSGPDMDHEEQRLMDYALGRLEQINEAKKRKPHQ